MSVPDDHYVNPTQLDMRNYRWPLEETSLGNINKRAGEQITSAMHQKQRRVSRQLTPTSSPSSSPCLSCLFPPGQSSGLRLAVEQKKEVECRAGQEYPRICAGETGGRDREDLRKDLLSRSETKKKMYLITPPGSENCSSRGSIDIDTRSEGFTVQHISRRYSSDNEFYESENEYPVTEACLKSPQLSGLIQSFMAYPQTIELSHEPQQMDIQYWNLPASSDQLQILTHGTLEAPSSIILCGRVYVPINDPPDMSQTSSQHKSYTTRREIVRGGDQTDLLGISMFNNSTLNVVGTDNIPLTENEIKKGPTSFLVSGHGPNKDVEKSEQFDTGSSPELSSQNTLTTKLMSNSQEFNDEITNRQSSIDMYLKKGSPHTIEDWSLKIPDNFDDELVESQSPSTTILMATAEEELGERISRVLHNDPRLAQILLSKLKHKLSFILPLLCDEEDQSPFDFSQGYYYNVQQRGPSGKTSSSGASISAKSTTGTSTTTPANSADLGDQGDDDVPQRPRKRPRIMKSRGRSERDQGRRRLRCHFHAKCAITHTEKTCVLSGWLSIHNLRGHHDTKHTRIRCNKCFQEFETKPPKNQHQRNCTLNSLPPTMDVIDCDKTDEIEDIFRTFRTWRLDREEDVVMKDWILKYKEEFISSNIPADDDHDCRELAKWYHMWRILFPSHEGPVPSPFQNASISPSDVKVERLVEVFQATVQAKVASNQHPPAELGPQIDYYTDIIRTVLRLFIHEPDPSFEPSAQSNTPSSGPLSSGPVDSSIASSLNTVPSVQRPSSLERQSSTSLSTPIRSVEQREVSSDLRVSTLGAFDATQTPSAPLSSSSPCSAETMGAGGEAPVIMRSQRTPSSRSSQPASPSQPQLPFTDVFGMPVQVHRMADPESLMPPPMTRAHSNSFAPQSLQHSFELQQQQQQSQQCSAQQFHLTMGGTQPQFIANNLAGSYFFGGRHQDQVNQNWSEVQMGQIRFSQSLHCGSCSDSGLLMQNGQMVQCPCGIFSGLQT